MIAKDHQIPKKWTDYKIFELKYGNTKLIGNTKHNQVKLILAVFVSAYLYQKHNPVKLVLAVFVSAYLYQYGIKLY